MTILPTGKHLRQTISKIVDSADSTIKIQKLDDQVRVNHRTISQHGCNYVISNTNESFFLKKSAVAFAICLESGKANTAKQIKHLDSKYQKLTEDFSIYRAIYSNTVDEHKKLTMCNRISECSPNLYAVKHELIRALKSIKIA
jgi:hypothetical protein